MKLEFTRRHHPRFDGQKSAQRRNGQLDDQSTPRRQPRRWPGWSPPWRRSAEAIPSDSPCLRRWIFMDLLQLPWVYLHQLYWFLFAESTSENHSHLRESCPRPQHLTAWISISPGTTTSQIWRFWVPSLKTMPSKTKLVETETIFWFKYNPPGFRLRVFDIQEQKMR